MHVPNLHMISCLFELFRSSLELSQKKILRKKNRLLLQLLAPPQLKMYIANEVCTANGTRLASHNLFVEGGLVALVQGLFDFDLVIPLSAQLMGHIGIGQNWHIT